MTHSHCGCTCHVEQRHLVLGRQGAGKVLSRRCALGSHLVPRRCCGRWGGSRACGGRGPGARCSAAAGPATPAGLRAATSDP